MKKVLLALLCSATVNSASFYDSILPGGAGYALSTPTSWGGIISYDLNVPVDSVEIEARTSLRYTTRSAEAPLTLSWQTAENIPWDTAFDNHWVSFTVYQPDGLALSAEFYPLNFEGPRTMAMYSAASASGDFIVTCQCGQVVCTCVCSCIPEPKAGWMLFALPLLGGIIWNRMRK